MTDVWNLPPSSLALTLAPRTLGAQPSLSGFTQVVASDAAVWKASLNNIPVHGDGVRELRAWEVRLEGRLNPVLVKIYEKARAPWPEFYGSLTGPGPDRSLDGTEYEGDMPPESEIVATVFSSVAQRATAMTIAVTQGGDLKPGQHFSVGERLYRIREIVSSVVVGGERRWNVRVRPPARQSITAGSVANFADPVCKMRLLTDNELSFELGRDGFGTVTVNLIEDPT